VRLTLELLRKRKKVVFHQSSDPNNELVKICAQKVNEITEIEEEMYKLTEQENKQIKEIELMEQEKLNIINEIKLYLERELRQMAKTRLKRKMKLEKTIEKLLQICAFLSTILKMHIPILYVLSAHKTESDVL